MATTLKINSSDALQGQLVVRPGFITCKKEKVHSKKNEGVDPNSKDITGSYSFPGLSLFEPRCEKTGIRGFRPGRTQTGLHSHRRWLEA